MRKTGRALGTIAGVVLLGSLLGVGGLKVTAKTAIVLGVGASLVVIGATVGNLIKQRRLAARKKLLDIPAEYYSLDYQPEEC